MAATGVRAGERCDVVGTAYGPAQHCVAEVPFAGFVSAYQPQYQSEWCWAACISMLFGYYGHPVSQARIVSEVYGGPANFPAGSGAIIARAVNRDLRDDAGNVFSARMEGAYDFDAGVQTLNNQMLVNALRNNRPFIIANEGHAMVGTAVGYWPTPQGPSIDAIGVFDPWPGVGVRGLLPAELVPVHMGGRLRFLVTVIVN